MTHDQRIEAMARAICTEDIGNAYEWDDTTSEILRESYRDQARTALAAAGVEEMLREVATRTRDAASEIARAYQGRFGESEVMDMDIDAIVARVLGK